MEHVDSEKTDRIHELLGYLYPNFDRHLRNYPNIEDFLNLLEMAKKFNSEEFITSDRWSETKLDEVKRITLKAVTDYIWDRMGVHVKHDLIQGFRQRQSSRGGYDHNVQLGFNA